MKSLLWSMERQQHSTNTSCSEVKEMNALQIENGSLGFIETLHKQWWSLQHSLHPLAYTWAELHFQRYNNGPNDPKGNENIIFTMVKYEETFYATTRSLFSGKMKILSSIWWSMARHSMATTRSLFFWENENIIFTLVKYGKTFYGHHMKLFSGKNKKNKICCMLNLHR